MDVLVENVLNATTATVTWVCLNVDSLEWEVLDDVPECYIPNTSMVFIGRYRSNCHTYSHPCYRVFDEDVLSALSNLVAPVGWFDCDCVVVAGDVDVSNDYVGACWVNSICVKWEGRDSKFQIVLSVSNT